MPPVSFWFCVDAGETSKGKARTVRMALHQGRRRRKGTCAIRKRALQQGVAAQRPRLRENRPAVGFIRGTAVKDGLQRSRRPARGPRAARRGRRRLRALHPRLRRWPPPRAGCGAPRRRSVDGAAEAPTAHAAANARTRPSGSPFPGAALGSCWGLRASIRRSNAGPRVLFHRKACVAARGLRAGDRTKRSGPGMPARS